MKRNPKVSDKVNVCIRKAGKNKVEYNRKPLTRKEWSIIGEVLSGWVYMAAYTMHIIEEFCSYYNNNVGIKMAKI